MAKLFFVMSLIAFPALMLCLFADDLGYSETGYFIEKLTLGNFGRLSVCM
jgi:uncharacterized membrane protein YiaA